MVGVKNDNLVEIIEVGRIEGGINHGSYYTLLEFVEGGTLESLAGKTNEETAINMLGEATSGLEELVNQGLVHQDIKPANILITEKGIKICVATFSTT